MNRQGVPIPAAQSPELVSNAVVGLWSGLHGVPIPVALLPEVVHNAVLVHPHLPDQSMWQGVASAMVDYPDK